MNIGTQKKILWLSKKLKNTYIGNISILEPCVPNTSKVVETSFWITICLIDTIQDFLIA